MYWQRCNFERWTALAVANLGALQSIPLVILLHVLGMEHWSFCCSAGFYGRMPGASGMAGITGATLTMGNETGNPKMFKRSCAMHVGLAKDDDSCVQGSVCD